MKIYRKTLKTKLHEIIFEADTQAGKLFDILLFWAIGISVLVVALDSVPLLNIKFSTTFRTIEWGFTMLFTFEYILRIYCNSYFAFTANFQGTQIDWFFEAGTGFAKRLKRKPTKNIGFFT